MTVLGVDVTAIRVIALLVAVAVIAFIVGNTHRVSVNFFTIHVSMPQWLALLLTCAAGVLIGVIAAGGRGRAKGTPQQ
ncbi:hypothetical protein BIV57_15655 [Mangrovactinospora gilvigrisea]|uniref:Lipopolysaccharide assembly protein A domain-containing protein n=1 Tax=Mangrovactinospora gilvigrisea TaxID=1428644 RepID=A0A1J7CAC1_9ACTN|nr:hypothetical protein BIV57_15655 [Mangrovactinospora gilvigrisea]